MTLGDIQWGQSLLLLAIRKDCRVFLAFQHPDSLLIWAIFVFHCSVPFGILTRGCFLNDGSCSRESLKGILRGLENRSQRTAQMGVI